MSRLSSLTMFAACVLGSAMCQHAAALTLESMGRFHVAETPVVELGTAAAWTVHYLVPDVRRARTPVILLPASGLSGYVYQATPDGREGWAQELARAGRSSYVVERIHQRVAAGQGELLSAEALWRRWGFGRTVGEPYGNVRFPIDAIEQLYAALPELPSTTEAATIVEGSDPRVATLVALLVHTGPAALLAHGDAAPIAFAAAAANPSAVRGLILIEPTGCARTETDVERLAAIPFLAVFGDYLQSRDRGADLDACRALAAVLDNRRGGRGEMLVLPEEGVFGNTYLLMQDDNSDEVAARVIRWINRRVD